jgi:hypothetical protein
MAGSTDKSPGSPDEIERALHDLEAELARPARFIEPSAEERARMGGRKMGWRNARKAKKLRKPVPEPRPAAGVRAPSAPSRQALGRSRASRIGTAIVLLAFLGVAGFEFSRLATLLSSGSTDQTPVTNGPTPAAQHTPAGRPTPSALPSPTLAAPFTGTPAASFADGAAGIVVPAAHRAGRFSAAQVAAAYRTTRRMLIAAHLNGRTLRGGSPDAFANLLIPQQRSFFVGHLDKIGTSQRGAERNTRNWLTSFAPGSTQFDGKVIKVHGTMRAALGHNGAFRVLKVHADYLFVYAVERPGQPATLMRIVVRDVVDVDFAEYTDPGGPLQPWWTTHGGGAAGARCDVHDGFVHPQFPNATPDKVRPSGPPVNPYDQSRPPPATGNCQATTGT